MELLFQTYQINYFTNNSDVKATPPILSMLLNKLSGLSLLPMFGNEVNPLTGEQRQVVIMTDAHQSFRIEFPMHAIVFNGSGGTSDEFLNKIESALKALRDIFPEKKSSRLAFLNSSFYKGTKEQYSELYNNLFSYHKADPFEWDNRIAEHIDLKTLQEKGNAVSTVRRCMVQSPFINNNMPMEVINFEVDSNTSPDNVNLKFDFENSIEVLNELHENNKVLKDNLSRYTKK